MSDDTSEQMWESQILDSLHEAIVLLEEHGHDTLALDVAKLYQKVGAELMGNE